MAEAVIAARDTMRARGPDDAGLHVETGVALAHRRLAIIDLSPAGRMPMSNETDDVWCVFNGEIYNFGSLRAELEARGHVFRSHTDSEVIIHGYEEWGDACFGRFDGMFAVALWDRREQRLILGRDAAGEKPLFFAHTARGVLFASTVAPLLTYPGGPRDVDDGAVRAYASFGFVPAPRSILRGVEKVQPGTSLAFERDGRVSRRVHFDFAAIAREPRLDTSYPESVDRVEHALKDAVRGCLVADVPLGAFLSGGVDSSLVVALMAEIDRRAVRTFTIGFAEREFDESRHANEIARHLGVENTMMVLTADDVRKEIPRVVEAFDEPMADYSALPTMAVARLARRHVTVALTGDGGDEAFAGYRYYSALAAFERLSWLMPTPVRKTLPWLRAHAPRGRLARGLERASLPDAAAFFGASGFYRGATASRGLGLVLPDLEQRPDDFVADLVRGAMHSGIRTATEAGLAWDAASTLPDAWLCKVDRASMAVSLETRAPLLRRGVLDLAFRLPLAHRVRGNQRKRVLRSVLKRHLPAALVDRPKQGFTPPMASWLRHELRDEMLDRLSRATVKRRGIFDPDGVERAVDEHLRGVQDHAQLLWALMHLEQWHERYSTGNVV